MDALLPCPLGECVEPLNGLVRPVGGRLPGQSGAVFPLIAPRRPGVRFDCTALPNRIVALSDGAQCPFDRAQNRMWNLLQTISYGFLLYWYAAYPDRQNCNSQRHHPR